LCYSIGAFFLIRGLDCVSIEEAIRERIERLLSQSAALSASNQHGQAVSSQQCRECSGWLVSAQNAIHLVCESASSAYRIKVDALIAKDHGWVINEAVGEMAAILRCLLVDADAGLLSSVADRARAETFDIFLDHADAYLSAGCKNEAGVIVGAVFEDTLRRICRKLGIVEKDASLDTLISALAAKGTLSGIAAKRARASAHVRTKASHAQWDEFALSDVTATVVFARELIAGQLDR
jgi:hypothetical protein